MCGVVGVKGLGLILQKHSPRQGREGICLHTTTETTNGNADGSIRLLQKLVREKQTEYLLLQQKFDTQGSEMNQLRAIVEELRESRKQQAGNETRLRLALKRASQNATAARYE